MLCEDSTSQAMEHTGEHTGGSSHTEHGGGASNINLNWAPVPADWNAEEQALIEQLGLEKYVDTCRDKDEAVALEAIHNYNATTRKTQVQGVTLELNAETIATAFDFLREPGKKEQKLSEVAISKYLEETEEELTDRKRMKQGITCSKIKQGRVYRFIAEAIAMKGTSTYIFEGMFGKILGKATKGYHVDVAREVADSTITQMEKVKNKSQKLVKCGHVWVGLYRQATSILGTTTTILPDVSSPSKPSKPGPKAVILEKRKAEQEPEEQASKKSKSASTSLSTDAKQGVDALQTIMERKRKERELKLQATSQHSSKQESEKKPTVKEEEVSQKKPAKFDLRVTSVKPPKPVDMVLHAKTQDSLQELHQQQADKLRRQRLAPVPLILEPQFAQQLTYGGVPVVVPRTVGLNADMTLESRMRSILSAVNTITTATVALVEESKSSGKDEVQELHQQLAQEQLLKDQLQTQKNDITQQLEREKELVQHSKDEIARLREKCQELTQEKNKALKEVQELKGARKGYKTLHIELGKELDRRYVFDSLASIMKPEESTDTVSFNLEELEELTAK